MSLAGGPPAPLPSLAARAGGRSDPSGGTDTSPRAARPLRIGWVVGAPAGWLGMPRRPVPATGGTPLVRYAWVMDRVNAEPAWGVAYEAFRRWRRYDAVIVLKSVSPEHVRFVEALADRRVPAIFDANVNYYEAHGEEHYAGMLPTAEQIGCAVALTRTAAAVIADSEFLRDTCARHNPTVTWIPDNVPMALVPNAAPGRRDARPLRLLWSGQAVKLFELLAIEEPLRAHARHVELVLVTNDLSALERWRPGHRARFERLMSDVPHQVIPFRSIPHLLEVYAGGGLLIAPRFLDNSYNLGHTEWKITLGMAGGRVALASPLPSYRTVAARAGGRGIRICAGVDAWESALDETLAGGFDWEGEEAAARAVVERHYATDVVAREHATFVRRIAAREGQGGPSR